MISESAINAFRASLAGELLLPGQSGYEESRKIHNAMIDRHPSMIVRCAGAGDVVAAVKLARSNGVTATVRGAGHNVAGVCLSDGAMLIDLSAMKRIHIDPEGRKAIGDTLSGSQTIRFTRSAWLCTRYSTRCHGKRDKFSGSNTNASCDLAVALPIGMLFCDLPIIHGWLNVAIAVYCARRNPVHTGRWILPVEMP